MAPSPDRDLIEFLRERMDPTHIPVEFEPGPTDDVDADGDVAFANYDGHLDYPLVAPVSDDPVVPGGGATGFTGMQSNGGPVQDTITTILVDCWGGDVKVDSYGEQDGYGDTYGNVYGSGPTHPDYVAEQLAWEVNRVCNAAAAADAPEGYEWISATPPTMADDTESHERTHYRDQVTVRMKHTRTF